MDSAIPAGKRHVPQGRIVKPVFVALVGIFYGIAVISAVGRIIIRRHARQNFHLDDILLVFACLCFTGATALLFKGLDAIFLIQALTIDPLSVDLPLNIFDQVTWFERLWWSYLSLTWTVIFAVKFAFLHFFRNLVDRLPRMTLYWKIIVGITIATYAFCLTEPFIVCHSLGAAADQCNTPAAVEKQLKLSILVCCIDIFTDILIVSIPLWLLWRVRWSLRQKLGVGAFLTLNICVAVVTIVKVGGLVQSEPVSNAWAYSREGIDVTWGFFWQQVEASVAITMLSLTAFRSLFGLERSSRGQSRPSPRRWYRSTMERIEYKKGRVSETKHDMENFPTIPSATLTGMRTVIRDAGGKTTTDERLSGGSSDLSTVVASLATKHKGRTFIRDTGGKTTTDERLSGESSDLSTVVYSLETKHTGMT